jgi:hypothetical protein
MSRQRKSFDFGFKYPLDFIDYRRIYYSSKYSDYCVGVVDMAKRKGRPRKDNVERYPSGRIKRAKGGGAHKHSRHDRPDSRSQNARRGNEAVFRSALFRPPKKGRKPKTSVPVAGISRQLQRSCRPQGHVAGRCVAFFATRIPGQRRRSIRLGNGPGSAASPSMTCGVRR